MYNFLFKGLNSVGNKIYVVSVCLLCHQDIPSSTLYVAVTKLLPTFCLFKYMNPILNCFNQLVVCHPYITKISLKKMIFYHASFMYIQHTHNLKLY